MGNENRRVRESEKRTLTCNWACILAIVVVINMIKIFIVNNFKNEVSVKMTFFNYIVSVFTENASFS